MKNCTTPNCNAERGGLEQRDLGPGLGLLARAVGRCRLPSAAVGHSQDFPLCCPLSAERGRRGRKGLPPSRYACPAGRPGPSATFHTSFARAKTIRLSTPTTPGLRWRNPRHAPFVVLFALIKQRRPMRGASRPRGLGFKT